MKPSNSTISDRFPKINQIWPFLQNQAAPILVLIYIALVGICFILLPVLFGSSLQVPFIGAFPEHTLIIKTTALVYPDDEAQNQFNHLRGSQIKEINRKSITDQGEFNDVLTEYAIDETITLSVLSPQGLRQTYTIKLQELAFTDQLRLFFIPYFVGLVYLLAGLYVFIAHHHAAVGRAFALFSTSSAIVLAARYESYTTGILVAFWTIALAVAGGALINLAMVFPETAFPKKLPRYLSCSGYGLAIPISVYAVSTIRNFKHPLAYATAWQIEYIFLILSVILFLVMTYISRRQTSSLVARKETCLILWGALISLIPLIVCNLISLYFPVSGFSSYLLLLLCVFPIMTGYAILRYHRIKSDYLLRQSVTYTILSFLAVGGYGLLLSGLAIATGNYISPSNPFVLGGLVFILTLAFNPLRIFLQNRIDRFFFHKQVDYRDTQEAFSRELTQIVDIHQITNLLRQYIHQAVMPSQMYIFVYDSASAHYVALPDANGHHSDIHFSIKSAFVQTLALHRAAYFIDDLSNLPATLQAEQARLVLLGVQLFIPLPGQTQLIGWVALGSRQSGEPYNNQDLVFLEVLSNQAALAIERSQVAIDLERHIHETTVLTRVAQGVSFTIVFDDILELISAQVGQLMPARDLRITLVDPETKVMHHVFYLRDDDRLIDKENVPLPPGQGLEWVVINNQLSLISNNYDGECRIHNLLPSETGIFAWMGVPLNTGADTIGLISIGSRDPAIIYTTAQCDLLQAIADQTSGAIVKARLLQESERRARQLSLLNEIGIDLTSTLNLNLLLKRILVSAIEILDCEAGSLFMVDQQTYELVFEVVISPVANNLQGSRLPAGTGLVGRSIEEGNPLLANNARQDIDWYEKTDLQTGFDTQDLLVVPMRVQDRVIGAIEVINKRNGAPFSEMDQDLLTAFTSQASIAIENARLYTLTDTALAARVEELSVMQRIDRELNASLDIERALRITLDWALRQSGIECGLVGMVEKEALRIMVTQGYQEPVQIVSSSDNGMVIPLGSPQLAEVLQTGIPKTVLAGGGSPMAVNLKPDVILQVIIPIRRETETIGLLVLESSKQDHSSDDMITFLSRLSDHAAIAIANARLYEEVKEANLAKSRFVSFVAHELKNPMSSIKGYTELVSGGMAGPVNEMQSSFLATVRSNVDRMNTIVSDLNDLTKIQVGNLRLDFTIVKVNNVVDEVIHSLRHQIEEKAQHYEIKIPDNLPMVWADPARMHQILINLVSNASKYTPQGGGFLICAEHYLEKELAGAEFVHLWVQDNGVGITEKDQEKVFQQYFRTEAAKEMAPGTGLGLNLTKSLIEMQGGRIWFDSRHGQGSTFHFTVPVAETQ